MIGLLRRLLSRSGEEPRREEPASTPMPQPRTIVLDTETTGLDPRRDELLSIGVVDLDGNPVWATMVRPERTTSWPEAEAVNGISYDDVADAPTVGEVVPKLQEVIDSADEVVGYNVGFDAGFLRAAGVDFSRVEVTDVMVPFAEVYGEWNDYFRDYKWQKLTTAAAYYGYDWSSGPGAHNALADAAATAWVWRHMREQGD